MKEVYIKGVFFVENTYNISMYQPTNHEKYIMTIQNVKPFKISGVLNFNRLRNDIYTVAFKYPQPYRNLIATTYYVLQFNRRFSCWVDDDFKLDNILL